MTSITPAKTNEKFIQKFTEEISNYVVEEGKYNYNESTIRLTNKGINYVINYKDLNKNNIPDFEDIISIRKSKKEIKNNKGKITYELFLDNHLDGILNNQDFYSENKFYFNLNTKQKKIYKTTKLKHNNYHEINKRYLKTLEEIINIINS